MAGTGRPPVLPAMRNPRPPDDPSPAALQTLPGQVIVVQGDSLFIATETGEERAFVMDTDVSVPPDSTGVRS